ncbi:ferric reductase like transmembrane component-domain-containing protein [Phellopilus nigrolimitatus]|nr:ferric reductase like transmembrane component-domain-containing protein [Phellopilus nigrolimitatus]
MSSIVVPSASIVLSVVASAPTPSESAAAPSKNGGSVQTSSSPSSDEILVYWLNIALLCVLALFFLARLPRAFGRFSRLSEWTKGIFLKIGSSPLRYTPQQPPSGRVHHHRPDMTMADESSAQSHTFVAHDVNDKGGKVRISRRSDPPMHVPALSSLFHPFSKLFSYPVIPGLSIGKFIIKIVYLIGVVVVTFLDDGNPFSHPSRVGLISASQVPVAIALGTKNNLVGMLLGMGYEKLNFLHRWVGIITFATGNIHALYYFYKWTIEGSLNENFQEPFVRWGLIGLIGLEILYFTSLGFFRHRAYNFFLSAHIIGIFLLLIGICFHFNTCVKYVVIGIVIYSLDHLIRIAKTRITTARILTVPELGLTRVELPMVRAGWRAGQHIRLRVLSMEMGWYGWSVAHPFTVANASRAGYYPSDNGFSTQREMRVLAEGPYGGYGDMVFASYSSAMLVAGGSGVTFALSQAEELVQAVHAGKSAIKFIELVWITQDAGSLAPLVPAFSALIEVMAPVPGVVLNISVFYSRASAKAIEKSAAERVAAFAPALSVHPGRPALPKTLVKFARLTAALQRTRGVAIGVCGPIELVEDVRRAARVIDGELRSACGGVELHEEVFGW